MPMILKYNRQADFFEESLPIGNGKLGALVYGGVDDNIIHLNDITFWTGKPVDNSQDSTAHRWIPKIREALLREDYKAADSLQLHVQGPNSQFYQPLATLHIEDCNKGEITGYSRRLDIDSSIVSDNYVRGGRQVCREYFASRPDKLIAIRLVGNINISLMLTGQTPHSIKATSNQLSMTGHAVGDEQESIHFCTMLRAVSNGKVAATDSALTISDATEATIYIVNETSFNGYNRHPVNEGAPYLEEAANDMWHTVNLSYEDIRQRHVTDYRHLYSRVSLCLGSSSPCTPQQCCDILSMPTDSLLLAYTDGTANQTSARYLETLYFQYGRYLLTACSRTKGVPANLQGLWTPHLWSPWRGNYTVNINLEENYWPAFVANLAETAQPLDNFIKALAYNGRHTAKSYYGIDAGWCSSHNSDIWAMTNPVGEKQELPEWANWNMGGAWLVNTLWEKYLFTRDTKYLLNTALPLMQGAADFCMNWLIRNPNNPKELITAPSTSPENEYVTNEGYHGMTCYGSTADMAIIRELFENTRQATNVAITSYERHIKKEQPNDSMAQRSIDVLKAYRLKLTIVLAKLHPYTVGSKGDLNEWYHDWDDYDSKHRHQSHLIGLYPGQHYLWLQYLPDDAVQAIPNQLSKDDFLKACEQTLIQKGDETTGWSTGWRINLWARLKKASEAYRIYHKLLTYVSPDGYEGDDKRLSGGTYPNLMDAHPPFQIDGNFGGTAGVCEMLMQSSSRVSDHHTTVIELLPACPKEWNSGRVSGLCARGGYEVSFEWQEGQVVDLSIKACCSGELTLLYNNKETTLRMKAGETKNIKTWENIK